MKSRKKSKVNGINVYEAEDSDAEEDKQAGQRYDVSPADTRTAEL